MMVYIRELAEKWALHCRKRLEILEVLGARATGVFIFQAGSGSTHLSAMSLIILPEEHEKYWK